jgi:hypothetical protein
MIGPRKVDRPLVLYGYGRLGHLAEEIFKELGIPIVGYWNKDCIPARVENLLVAICVATEPYEKVTAPLKAAGWEDTVPVWDIVEAYPEVGIRNGWFAGEMTHEDRENVSKVVLKFSDRVSVSHYYAFLDWRKYHDELDYVPAMDALPSTLANIRERQRVITFADLPMRNISIHAEGAELKTLEVNMPLFQRYRPTLCCACYHSRDGLYLIEKTLMDNLPRYIWQFRLHAYMGQGAYIYGTPEEKAL